MRESLKMSEISGDLDRQAGAYYHLIFIDPGGSDRTDDLKSCDLEHIWDGLTNCSF